MKFFRPRWHIDIEDIFSDNTTDSGVIIKNNEKTLKENQVKLKKPVRKKSQSYKHSTCVPRWNNVETTVSTSFQRGIHVVCLKPEKVLLHLYKPHHYHHHYYHHQHHQKEWTGDVWLTSHISVKIITRKIWFKCANGNSKLYFPGRGSDLQYVLDNNL